MESSEIIAIINTLAEYPMCFSHEEIFTLIWEEKDRQVILEAIEEDARFIRTREETSGTTYFITEKALFKWYINLIVRLTRAKNARLNHRQLGRLMSSLLLDGVWSSPPTEYITYGRQYSLISPTLDPREYVFPLAHVLSFMTPKNTNNAAKYLYDFYYSEELSSPTEQRIKQSIEDLLERFSNRERYIISKREGLLGNIKMTLEQIGRELGVTRERIRQVEEKCWRRLWHPLYSGVFVIPLFRYLLSRRGSLVVSSTRMRSEIRFISKCLNIPFWQFPYTKLMVLGNKSFERLEIANEMWDSLFDIEAVANFLQSDYDLVLDRDDLLKIAEVMSPILIKRLTKSQKVYLALKMIGRPAHYDQVSETYYSLFPEDESDERTVHNALINNEHGVVWIGIKGTYALEEWGYERPSSTLFDTVSEIVQKKFDKTGNPVPFAVIAAEIGKYRRLVKPASETIAVYCNRKLKNVSEDCFIPQTTSEEEKDISKDELDKILKEFERRTKEHEMIGQMTYDRALQIASEALEAYKRARTKEEVEEIFIKYGRGGIGYRPLCRIFFSRVPPENAIKVYKRE